MSTACEELTMNNNQHKLHHTTTDF